MRQIFLLLDDIETGPMSVHEVLERVGDGRAGAETLYWEDGLEEWAPLTALLPALAKKVEGDVSGEVTVATAPHAPATSASIPPQRRLVTGTPAALPHSGVMEDPRLRAHELRLRALKAERSGQLVLMAWLFALAGAGGACFHFMPVGRLVMIGAAATGFVFAVVAMFSGRYFSGLVALLVAALLPAGLFLYVKKENLRPSGFAKTESEGSEKSVVRPGFRDVKLEVEGETRRLSGVVEVPEAGRPEALEIVVTWLDADKTVVDQSVLPLANGAVIPPGASAKFSVDVPADPAISTYTTSLAPLQ